MPGSIVHIDLIPFPEICLGGIQYHMLICDEFSTYLHSFAMKTKSNSDIIVALTSMVSYFKQYGYDIKVIHSDHESALISATSFINQQGIQYHTIAPYQHEQKLERYVQTINARFRSVLSSLKYKLPNKLYGQLFIAILKYLNMVPNSVHPTLTPSIIFQGYKLDITTQSPIPFGTFAVLHYAKRVINKYEPHTENGIVLYLADNITSNVVAWIPGRNTVATINKYTIIKASSSDFGLQDNTNIIVSHIPDFLSLSSRPQEGATIQAHPNLQNQKLCSISPVGETRKKFGTPAPLSPSIHVNDNDPITSQDTMNEPYWEEEDTSSQEKLLTLENDVPYTRQSIRNLKFHQPVAAVVLKASSGISVKKALLVDERKTIAAIMDEVKNMLD